ncbi:unnamed protein product [Penicillium nalgiovense]|nr:unnamed protein product [Penicillium nalgiovense]
MVVIVAGNIGPMIEVPGSHHTPGLHRNGKTSASMDSSQSLRDACGVPDSLFVRSDEDLIRLVYKEFPEEIDRLRRAYSIRDGPWTPSSTPSPSYILYNEEYDDVNRTLIHGFYTRLITDANALFTVITSIIVNDLGKDP